MSDNTSVAEAISNYPDLPAVGVSPPPTIEDLLAEIRSLEDRIEALEKHREEDTRVGKQFAIQTTNDIDALFHEINRFKGIRKPGGKQKARLAKLDHILISRNNEPLTFAEVGKLLELGRHNEKGNTRRQAMTKFRRVLESMADQYEISESKAVKGSKLVRLSKDYYYHVRKKAGEV